MYTSKQDNKQYQTYKWLKHAGISSEMRLVITFAPDISFGWLVTVLHLLEGSINATRISGVVVHVVPLSLKKTNQYGSSGFITQDRLQQPCDSLCKSHAIPWSKSNHSSPSCLAEPVGSGQKQRDINIDDHDNVGLWFIRFAIAAIFPNYSETHVLFGGFTFVAKKLGEHGRVFFGKNSL